MKQVLLQLIKIGAALPVSLKGGIVEKVLRRIQNVYIRNGGKDAVVRGNMGINNKLRVELPVLKTPSYFLFGTAFSYKGEYHTLQLANFLNQHCSAFVDIGANWGFYSYYIAAHNENKPIFWFEPNPELYNYITGNLSRNNFKKVRGSDYGLSDTDGTLTFYLNQSSDLMSSIVQPESEDGIIKQTINTTRFDSWAMGEGIPGKLLVKVDVENAEWQFIRGAEKALDKIEYLIIEVLGPARQSGFINYVIKDLGLQAYYIDENKLEYVREEDMRYTKGEFNWLFCRQTPEVLAQKLSGSIFKVIPSA